MASRALRVTYSAAFACLPALGAYLVVPLGPVPFTLQTFFVYLAGVVLDPWAAAGSQVLYLLLGIAGLPVFAGGAAGPAVIFSPVGGFLLSFPVAALVESLVARRGGRARAAAALTLGVATVFGMGISYYFLYVMPSDVVGQLAFFAPFVVWDGIKASLAYFVGRRLSTVTRGGITSAPR